MKSLKPSRLLTTVLLFALPLMALAQWTKNQSLSGGNWVSDIIEFNQSLFVAYKTTGIFRSDDQGVTWVLTSVPGQYNMTHMVVAGSRLVAISSGKIYSTANGVDWTTGTGPSAFINEADSDGDVIFAATHEGVYKSVDHGLTWQRATDVQAQVAIKSISVSGNIIWASLDLPAAGSLLMSNDGGATWTKIAKGTVPANDVAVKGTEVYINLPNDGIYKSANNGADWQLVRNLSNSYGRMSVSTDGIFYASPYAVYYSKNSGDTWVQKTKSFPFFNFSSLYATTSNIYLGLIGGGILTSSHSDASADWLFINNGIASQHIHDFVLDGNKLYAGLENSFLRISENLGDTWSQKSGPFGLFSSSVRALMVKSGVIYTGSGGGGVSKSTDGGATWMEKNLGLVSKNIYSIVSTATSIFVATDDGVYKSTNGGDSWTKKTADGIAIRKAYSDGSTLYAAAFNGLYESKDDGETWKKINEALPEPSVNDVIRMGPVLIAASQHGGVYQTTNSGTTWTKLNDLFVTRFGSHNQYLFMSVLGGQLLISGDTARTSEDIAAALPTGGLTFGGVMGENIIAAKADLGYWTRKATTLMKPYVTLTSPRAENRLSLTESISLISSQRLFSAEGVPISSANIGTHISVKDKDGNPVAFSSVVLPGEKSVTLTITNPEVDATYAVIAGPLLNENGLSSSQIVSQFTVINPSPVIADVIVNMDEDRKPVAFTNEMFEVAYEDEQLMSGIVVKTLPANGQLKIGDTPVTVNQVIPNNTVDNLTYTALAEFSGNDSWNWNASDGTTYAAADAKVTIVVPTITDISEISGPEVRVYPNPASSFVQLDLVADVRSVKVYDITGREMSNGVLSSRLQNDRTIYMIDTRSYKAGLYLVRIDFGSRQLTSRFVKN